MPLVRGTPIEKSLKRVQSEIISEGVPRTLGKSTFEPQVGSEKRPNWDKSYLSSLENQLLFCMVKTYD